MEHRQTASRPFAASQTSLRWLGWLVLVAIVALIWAPSLRSNVEVLSNPPPGAEPALRDAYISAGAHATYHLSLDLVFGLGCVVTAASILRRASSNGLAVVAAFILAAWGPLNGLAAEATAQDGWWARAAACVAWLGLLGLVAASVSAYGSAGLRERQQIRWLWYGTACVAVLFLAIAASVGSAFTLTANQIDRHMTSHLLFVVVGAALPTVAVISWVLPNVPDPDTLIRRTMVYGVLTAVVAGSTVLFVLLPAALYYELGPVYLLFVVCAWAVLGLPLQHMVQRAINRLLYGQRDEPMAVLTALGERLELGSPETVLSAMVETVATTLKVPSVAIRSTEGDEILASVGHSDLQPESLPIAHHGEQVGLLVVSPRARGEPLHERDYEILRLVARQAGPTVRAVQLNQELRRSRQEILSGREEERRRIRRDLHDGLGPALAAIAMQADTARAVVDDDPETARELMAAVTSQAEEVVQDVRRLVYELRPPALDELGLLGAIERLARQSTTGNLRVEVVADSELPDVSAAVEVAIYRLVAEALANVVRHAQAKHCTITLAFEDDGALTVGVDDDGIGFNEAAPRGLGLRSMRERSSELGAEFAVGRRPSGGTRVEARFTVPVNERAPSGGPS